MNSEVLDLERKNLVWYRDIKSGVIFVGDGAFLDVRTPSEIFNAKDVDKVEIISPLKMAIEKGVCVTWTYCHHSHNFFATDLVSIKVVKGLFEEDAVTIEVSPSYLDTMIQQKSIQMNN